MTPTTTHPADVQAQKHAAATGAKDDARTAARILRVLDREAADAVTRAREHRAALEAARTAMYQAEEAERLANGEREANGTEILRLLRAVAHRAEDEPIEEPSANTWRTERRFRATFAVGAAYLEHTQRRSGGVSRGPKRAVAWISAHHQTPSTTLYQSARGTSDPDRQEAEYRHAQTVVLEALQPYTADGYLRAFGLDPAAVGPVEDLLQVIPGAHTMWYGNEHWPVPTWQLALAHNAHPVSDNRRYVLEGAGWLAKMLYELEHPNAGGAAVHEATKGTYPESFATLEEADAYAREHIADALRALVGQL